MKRMKKWFLLLLSVMALLTTAAMADGTPSTWTNVETEAPTATPAPTTRHVRDGSSDERRSFQHNSRC